MKSLFKIAVINPAKLGRDETRNAESRVLNL